MEGRKSIRIRKAKIEDLEKIRELNRKLFKHDFKWDETLDCDWPNTENATKYFTKSINSEDSLTLVADDNSNVIGYMIASHEKTPFWMKQDITMIELENTYIEDGYRKQGVGTKMYTELEKWAKNNGANMIKVVANAYNEEGTNFYRKMSFKETDTTFQKELK